VEKDGAELSREEPEDVDGESGGVACRSAAWGSKEHAWDISRDEDWWPGVQGEVGDAGRIKKRMKREWGAPAPRNMTASGLVGGQCYPS
jgi:hypothetical protein